MDKIKVIILCGGCSKRWATNVKKHFLRINGISILENTIQLLRDYPVNISIIAKDNDYHIYCKYHENIITINNHQSQLEYYKIKSTYSLWSENGRTVILMGDVWFSKESIKRILTYQEIDIAFWGRQRANFHTKCNHGEIFAISFFHTHAQQIQSACEKLAKYIEVNSVKIAGGWGMYDILSNLEHLIFPKVIRGRVLFSNFHNIFDITDDIDKPIEYENLKIAINRKLWQKKIISSFSSIYYSMLTIENIFFEIYNSIRK